MHSPIEPVSHLFFLPQHIYYVFSFEHWCEMCERFYCATLGHRSPKARELRPDQQQYEQVARAHGPPEGIDRRAQVQ